MSNAAMRALRKSQGGTFGLQITSMIDMFTLILVFLLKSYSSSTVTLVPGQGLNLPGSTATNPGIEALEMTVSSEGIFVDSKQIIKFDSGRLPASVMDKADNRFIRPLFEALNEQATKSKGIAEKNEDVKFDGKIILQADRSIPYALLKQVMYTATIAGYSDFKFAVISMH
ncbi:MAG: biopolymer transporter ExbD [Oligoflexia bacterium]|nr:biopolymer transporter ExbD [Oligoflexia bacterium]